MWTRLVEHDGMSPGAAYRNDKDHGILFSGQLFACCGQFRIANGDKVEAWWRGPLSGDLQVVESMDIRGIAYPTIAMIDYLKFELFLLVLVLDKLEIRCVLESWEIWFGHKAFRHRRSVIVLRSLGSLVPFLWAARYNSGQFSLFSSHCEDVWLASHNLPRLKKRWRE